MTAAGALAEASPRPTQLLWAQALRAGLDENAHDAQLDSLETSIQGHLENLLKSREETQHGAEEPAHIPTFYKQKAPPGSVGQRARRLAQVHFAQKQADSLLTQQELERLWCCLRDNRTLPDDDDTERINYDDFCQVAAECGDCIGAKCKHFFTAASFLTFETDDLGRIAILPFYLYIVRWVSLTKSHIDMCVLDSRGDGYLTPEEIEAFIRQLVPSLPLLKDVDQGFVPTYCLISACKFFFFLDPQRKCKVLIRELLLTPVLSELMELRQDGDAQQSLGSEAQNWFALENIKRIHDTFLALDSDHSGTLSRTELQKYNKGSLTDIFVERVFDEHVRPQRSRGKGSGAEMTLRCFVDLLLALEEKNTPQGLAFLFRCLDVRSCGHLTVPDVYTLFRAVHRRWADRGYYELSVADVKDEIWDMVRPEDPLKITLTDLIRCGQGGTVAAMLTDIDAFWAHDNREMLVAQQDTDAG